MIISLEFGPDRSQSGDDEIKYPLSSFVFGCCQWILTEVSISSYNVRTEEM